MLRQAVSDLSWLLQRGYPERAALKLVGDRYGLRARQRQAVQRCAASDEDCARRSAKRLEVDRLAGDSVVLDGYNVLLSLEAALSGGALLLARDGTLRDLAAMSAHYRRLHTTEPAIELLAEFFDRQGCSEVICYLDRPVSNSGRLKRLMLRCVAERRARWRVDLTDRTDHLLKHSPHVVATADSAVLDDCKRWLNLVRIVVEGFVPDAWIIDLRGLAGSSLATGAALPDRSP